MTAAATGDSGGSDSALERCGVVTGSQQIINQTMRKTPPLDGANEHREDGRVVDGRNK